MCYNGFHTCIHLVADHISHVSLCLMLHTLLSTQQKTDSVLQRGEKLEDLVERSGELSAQSKLFYREAKKANSCCAVV